MASWADRRDAYTMQRREQARADQRRNALNEIFASAYEPGETTETPMYGPTQTGAALPPVVQQRPGRVNIQNALARMYTGGFAPEAIQLEQDMRNADLKRMQLGQQPSAVQVYEYYKGLPDDQSREAFLRTLRSPQYGEVGGVRAEMPILPGAGPRPLGTLQSEVSAAAELESGKASGRVAGEKSTEADLAIPGAEATASNVSKLIEELKAHPGKNWAIGAASTIPDALTPGTSRIDFAKRLEQIQGTAFLEARQLLKGGGAITDFESKRAEAAYGRMSRALKEEDFDKALDDFNEVVQQGVTKLRAKSGRSNSATQGPISPTQPKAPRQARNPGDIVNTRNGPMLIQRVNPDGTYEGIPAR